MLPKFLSCGVVKYPTERKDTDSLGMWVKTIAGYESRCLGKALEVQSQTKCLHEYLSATCTICALPLQYLSIILLEGSISRGL